MYKSLIKALTYAIPRLLLLILMFYHIYPQALAIRGSSFILASGITGMFMYFIHKMPFRQGVFSILIALSCFLAVCFHSAYANNFHYDFYLVAYMKSHLAWIFTSYIIVYYLYKIHKTPSFNLLLAYIVAAIALQSIITLVMYFNQPINDFLFSIQLQTDIDEHKREASEGKRLIGYGAAFFGIGIVAGYALVLTMFIMLKTKLKTWGQMFVALIYTLIFFVGLFSARTTVIGLASSFVLMAIILLYQPNGVQSKQISRILGYLSILSIIAITLSFIYLDGFTDWAFEIYYNYARSSKIETKSSSSLYFMLRDIPSDFKTFMLGTGSLEFFGNDVGYIRLLYYVGLPGTLIYFLYGIYVASKSFNRDKSINILIVILIIYNLAMNIKGLTDLNLVFYLFFFYFMFYKRDFYYPRLNFQMAQKVAKPIQK